MPTKHRHTTRKFVRSAMIATAIVLFWKGMWGLLDVLLFPGFPIVSDFAAMALGVAILFLTHRLREIV